MDVSLNLSENIQIDKKTFLKMNFLYNAINEGWSVTKNNKKYIFTKAHNGKKEVFSDEYLDIFIKSNLIINRKNK